jgi:hypothetical protein
MELKNSTFRIFMVLGAGVAMGLIVIFTWLPRLFPPKINFIFLPPPSASKSTSTAPYINTQAPQYKTGIATMFWVGESAGSDNDYIQNIQSYWDSSWAAHFGGIDDPVCRKGFLPCGFTPKENPFYVALPYGERDPEKEGKLKESAMTIPWFSEWETGKAPLLKNRWIAVRRGYTTCFGQLQDVGPNESNDVAYVFGSADTPKNTFGVGAGIDLSPALFTCLGMTTNEEVSWRFVASTHVPPGPWKQTITTRDVDFSSSEEN